MQWKANDRATVPAATPPTTSAAPVPASDTPKLNHLLAQFNAVMHQLAADHGEDAAITGLQLMLTQIGKNAPATPPDAQTQKSVQSTGMYDLAAWAVQTPGGRR